MAFGLSKVLVQPALPFQSIRRVIAFIIISVDTYAPADLASPSRIARSPSSGGRRC